MEPVGKDTPIFLQTDASNYSISAYLFQRVDGVERTIAILSKGWSTFENIQYANFSTLRKLRDGTFTLQTDHKYLTY